MQTCPFCGKDTARPAHCGEVLPDGDPMDRVVEAWWDAGHGRIVGYLASRRTRGLA